MAVFGFVLDDVSGGLGVGLGGAVLGLVLWLRWGWR